jgi:hypothetical protein
MLFKKPIQLAGIDLSFESRGRVASGIREGAMEPFGSTLWRICGHGEAAASRVAA